MNHFTGAVLAGVVGVFGLQFFLWLLQQKWKNAGFVDLGWALSIGLMAAVYGAAAPGDLARKALVCAMPLVWSTRLSAHLVRRFLHEKKEDPRYAKMRAERGEKASGFFLFFFLFQAALAVILTTPFYVASKNPAPGIRPLEIGAFALWALALIGETAADLQMRNFRENPANKGKVCDAGLWRYSRHPNYFFESLMWWAWFFFALASPGGLWAIVSPALMTFFLLKVSGVPPAEEQSLRSRGDLYRRYQQTTSVFVPWFPKEVR